MAETNHPAPEPQDVEGHKWRMSTDAERTEGVEADALPDSTDDVEGHGRRFARQASAGAEDTDDTEGHRPRWNADAEHDEAKDVDAPVDPADDVEGHRRAW